MPPLFRALLHIVFPMREDARLVQGTSGNVLLERMRHYTDDGITALLPFSDPLVRACIHEVKFHENEKAIRMLAGVLQKHFSSLPHTVVLIPIPLSHKRQKERGYNQVERVVRCAGASLPHAAVRTDILEKIIDTPPQTKLSRKDRLKNVSNCYKVFNGDKIRDKHIVLIDDVTTTGATLRAAKTAFLPHHPTSITCLALAH